MKLNREWKGNTFTNALDLTAQTPLRVFKFKKAALEVTEHTNNQPKCAYYLGDILNTFR